MRWCRVYECWREAAPGSTFCRLKHGWWEPQAAAPVAVVVPLPIRVLTEDQVVVRDCVGCEQSFEQERRPAKHFSYCEMCRGIAA